MHKLYALNNYFKDEEFIKNNYKEYNLKNLIKELQNDKGYHMRVHENNNYILFGDCDHFRGTFIEFSELLINFFDIIL
jgi:hypothetical protein